MPWAIGQYQTERGDRPVERFIESLPKKGQAKVYAAITFLAEKGNELREPFSKSMGSGLFELRVKNHRLIYCYGEGKNIVLLHAFIKKTRKTPDRELDLALQRLREVQRR